MAFVKFDVNKLKYNFDFLDKLFGKNNIHWAVVSKILSGNKLYLTELLKLDIKQMCDSRVSNLKMVKQLKPEVETIYIKPPAKRAIPNVVKYADISMNTEFSTIQLLSDEAKKQDKVHKIIIMIELGELREGVMAEDFMDFYEKVFLLPNIKVIGIGTNLSCLYGVLPNSDKLIQLSLYEQLIEAKFNRQIPFVSGGSSVTIPMIQQNILPKGINHFRVGETLFIGTDVYNSLPFKGMKTNLFKLYSEIIELIEKPIIPQGDFGTNLEGNSFEFDQDKLGETSYRAIIDIGLLDVPSEHLFPTNSEVSIVGASSDMVVVDLGQNKSKLKTGDLIEFNLDYMGVLRIINSKYIEKIVK